MTEETRRELLPSATGFAARRAIAVLRKCNVPIAPLLTRAGIPEGDIDNRQARISALAQGKLLGLPPVSCGQVQLRAGGGPDIVFYQRTAQL